MVGTVPRSLADWMWPFVRCFTGVDLGPRPGAGRWSPAEPGAAHRHRGAARHGPGPDARALPFIIAC